MSELSSEARALVEAARASDGPALNDKARVKQRLMRQLGVGAFAGAAAVSVVRSAASSSSAPMLSRVPKATSTPTLPMRGGGRGSAPWLKSLGKVAAAATAAGAIYSGVTLIGNDAGRAASRQLEHLQPAPAPTLEPTIEPLADAHPQIAPHTESASEGSAPRTKSRHTRGERSSQPGPQSDSLAQELSLLARAQRSLRQEDPRAALAIVQEHTARFPEGSLQEERSGIEALARCLLGESHADSVQEFLKRSPSSPLAARVRKECGSRR